MTFFKDLLTTFVENLRARVREALDKEPARIRGYGTAAAVAVTLWVAGRLGLNLSTEFLALVGAAGALAAIELVRAAVYAPATVDSIVDEVIAFEHEAHTEPALD